MKTPNEVDVSAVKSLTLKNTNAVFMHLDKFLAIMEEWDTNGERISQVRRAIKKNTKVTKNFITKKKEMGNL
ncbi:hypothetical protein HZS_1069 [Henneguya salminicola]|nr:hypothetical protein HZS_1069 [Henneguya salminicola]